MSGTGENRAPLRPQWGRIFFALSLAACGSAALASGPKRGHYGHSEANTVSAAQHATQMANINLFSEDFESCQLKRVGEGGKYYDFADNQISNKPAGTNGGLSHTGKCSVRANGYGKLVARLSSPSPEIWIQAYVLFPLNYSTGFAPRGPHIWRIFQCVDCAGGSTAQLDVDQGSGTAVLYHVPDYHVPRSTGGVYPFRRLPGTNVFKGKLGVWQCWELHSRLNTPGKLDGVMEFYRDGLLMGKLDNSVKDAISAIDNQTCYPKCGDFRGTSPGGYTIVDIQSNIGGGSGFWPSQNYWYLDDVVISSERRACP